MAVYNRQQIAVQFDKNCLMLKHAESPLKSFSHSFQVSTKALLESPPKIEEEKYSAWKTRQNAEITEKEYASLFPNYQKEILQWATNDLTKYSAGELDTQASFKESAALLEQRNYLFLQFVRLQTARQLLEKQSSSKPQVVIIRENTSGGNFFRNYFVAKYLMEYFTPSTPDLSENPLSGMDVGSSGHLDDSSPGKKADNNTEEFNMYIDKEELIDDIKGFDDSKEFIKEDVSGVDESKEYFKQEVKGSSSCSSWSSDDGGGDSGD